MTHSSHKRPRLFALDALRVFAIAMMLAYHFIYDLKYFGYVDWNTPLGNGFRQWRTTILFGFIFSMGVSMGIAHSRRRKIRSFLVRLFQIFACAVVITVMSLILFPESWIYFGILHFMSLASILTFAFVRRPRLALATGTTILLLFWIGWVPYRWPFMFIPNLPSYTEDFVSPFPWFGVAFIGLGLGDIYAQNPSRLNKLRDWELGGITGKLIKYAGTRSLFIYMVHQPLLFTLFITFAWVMR